jgi:hypothetical protein
MAYRFHALPKEALLLLVCERVLAELGATAAERARPGGAAAWVIWRDRKRSSKLLAAVLLPLWRWPF